MVDSIIEGMAGMIKDLLELAFSIYNILTGMAVEMLGQNPAAWNSSGWNFVESVNAVFLGIAAVLVAIFFLMGLCMDNMDIRQDYRIENIIRVFIKLSLAEFFVVNSLKLVKSFFGIATGIINKISGTGISFAYSLPGNISNILNDPKSNGISEMGGLLWLVGLMIMGIVFLLVVSGCGMMVLYEAFQRFFKILLLVPYGTLANSTIAGNHALGRSAEAFWKYTLGTILEAVTMYMALALSAAVLTSGVISLTDGETGGMYVAAWMLESSFICMMTLGVVKGASNITQRTLGLS